jgi:hypothetical protein
MRILRVGRNSVTRFVVSGFSHSTINRIHLDDDRHFLQPARSHATAGMHSDSCELVGRWWSRFSRTQIIQCRNGFGAKSQRLTRSRLEPKGSHNAPPAPFRRWGVVRFAPHLPPRSIRLTLSQTSHSQRLVISHSHTRLHTYSRTPLHNTWLPKHDPRLAGTRLPTRVQSSAWWRQLARHVWAFAACQRDP